MLIGGTKLSLAYPSTDIDRRRMISSIAPNYIHGNDAAHLALTVDELRMQGVNSVAVIHDDFGTHAADTETLHMALRGCMVEMYEEDRLTEFRETQELSISKTIDVKTPEFGTLDLQDLYSSTYMFS